MRSPSSELAPPLNRLIYSQILTRWNRCAQKEYIYAIQDLSTVPLSLTAIKNNVKFLHGQRDDRRAWAVSMPTTASAILGAASQRSDPQMA
ncbi:hypothetical protein TNCV_936191 [Trichonephila clavipes]|nr:hypothetical protein TNCV_936191 [Trichonephila clavipes]